MNTLNTASTQSLKSPSTKTRPTKTDQKHPKPANRRSSRSYRRRFTMFLTLYFAGHRRFAINPPTPPLLPSYHRQLFTRKHHLSIFENRHYICIQKPTNAIRCNCARKRRSMPTAVLFYVYRRLGVLEGGSEVSGNLPKRRCERFVEKTRRVIGATSVFQYIKACWVRK